jgi:hypothetical protein
MSLFVWRALQLLQHCLSKSHRKYNIKTILCKVNQMWKLKRLKLHQYKTDHLIPDSRQTQTLPDTTIDLLAFLAATVATIRTQFHFFRIAWTAHSQPCATVIGSILGVHLRHWMQCWGYVTTIEISRGTMILDDESGRYGLLKVINILEELREHYRFAFRTFFHPNAS